MLGKGKCMIPEKQIAQEPNSALLGGEISERDNFLQLSGELET